MMRQAIFMLGEEKYGLDIMDISIIEKVIKVEPKAGLSGNFKGVIDLRGEIIPVYSLRRRFGLSDIEYNEDTRFVITSSNGKPVAYEVDRVVEIVQVEKDTLLEVPEITINSKNDYMKNVVKYGDNLVIILDPEKIMTEEEQAAAQKITK